MSFFSSLASSFKHLSTVGEREGVVLDAYGCGRVLLPRVITAWIFCAVYHVRNVVHVCSYVVSAICAQV
jgi:hypothetical protein